MKRVEKRSTSSRKTSRRLKSLSARAGVSRPKRSTTKASYSELAPNVKGDVLEIKRRLQSSLINLRDLDGHARNVLMRETIYRVGPPDKSAGGHYVDRTLSHIVHAYRELEESLDYLEFLLHPERIR